MSQATKDRQLAILFSHVHRFLARMLLQRNAEGDADRAGELLRTAIEEYRAMRMERHAELAMAQLHGDPVGATEP